MGRDCGGWGGKRQAAGTRVVGATCVCVSHVVLARQHAAGWQLLQFACCTPARMHPSWQAHRCRGRSAGAGRSPWCRATGAHSQRGRWRWGRARGWRSRTGSLQTGAGSTGEGSTVGAMQQAESDERAGDTSERQPHLALPPHPCQTRSSRATSAPASSPFWARISRCAGECMRKGARKPRIFSRGTCAVWFSHSFMPTICRQDPKMGRKGSKTG